MTIRDSGWIMLYAEDNQEALDLHMVAYKVAEQLSIPVMVNMDGFVLTHTVETVEMPELSQVKKYLPDYRPIKGQFLDVNNPRTLGAFATPEDYMPIREDLFKDLMASKAVLRQAFAEFKNIFNRGTKDLVEYYGDPKAKVVFVAMGSVIGTIKDTVDELNAGGKKTAVVKIKSFRPFPTEEIIKKLSGAKFVAVIDKSISLGQEGIIATEIKSVSHKNIKAKVQSFILGLGGRDITKDMIASIYKKVQLSGNKITFIK